MWGENFGPWAGVAQGTSGVSFSGVWGTPTYWSETEIRVPVPPGVESSLVVVTAGGSASNGVEFTVTSGGKAPGGRTEDWVVSARSAEAADEEAGPAITSLDPVEGAVGTAVTITGTNFGATAGEAGRVSFNGTQGVPTSWSETTIQVPVPAGATTGPVRVTAQAGGVSNGVEFSVRPAISLESFRGRWEWRPPVTITVRVPEGEEPATDTPVTFTFGGTAERGTDYEMAATVTLPAGARSVRTRLELIDDAHFELRETIILQAAAGERTATITVSVPEAVGAPVEVTLNRSGTATSGVDYTLAETVTIPAGTSTTATLQVIDDRIDEGTETVEVQASADGYGPSDAVAVPIGDDDTAGLTVTPADLSLTEGGSGQYEVRLDSQPLHPVTITIASSNPDVEAPTPLSFTADNWNQFQAVTVTVAHDDDATDESATVTHTAESGDLNYQGIPVPSVSVSVSDDDNQPPRCDSIATQILRVADSQTVDLSGYCSDADGHPLAYTASSSDTSEVTVSMDGSSLTLTGVAVGSTTITLTATDQPGESQEPLSTTETFTARVKNRDPECDAIADQTVKVGKSKTLTVSCSDGDGHSLSYTASSSDTSKVTVEMTGSSLKITGVAATASPHPTVTVTARDGHGGSDTVSFRVTVKELPSCDLSSIGNQTLFVDGSRTLDLSSVCDGTYSASSSPSGIVTVSVNNSTDELTIHGESVGMATVTVTVRESGYKPDSVSFRVTVVPRSPSPNASLSASPTTIFPGERTTLSWTTTNAVSGSINGEPIARSDLASGSKQVRLDSSQAFTLSVTGEEGARPLTATDDESVTVVPRPPSPTASLTADSTTITEGGCTDLRWETEHAERASINQGIGTVTPTERGSIRVCPDSTEIYELTATGAEGAKPLTATASVTVTVNPPRPSSPVITSISPSLQRPDDRVTISGNHFGTTAGSVSFGGHSVSIFSGPGYSWSNTSIGLLISGSLSAGQVSVTVTTHCGSTSDSYSYTVTGSPVRRGDCEEEDEDCEKEKEDEGSGESEEGETDEDPAEGGG